MKKLLFLILFSFLSLNLYPNTLYIEKHKNLQKIYLNGNQLELAHFLGNTILEIPENPDNFIYLNDLYSLQEICGHKYIIKTCDTLLQKIKKINSSEINLLKMLVLRIKSSINFKYRKKNYSLFAKKYKPLNNYQVYGPFWKYGNYDLYYPFLKKITKKKKNINSKIIKTKDPKGFIYPRNYFFPEKGIIYINKKIYLHKPVLLRIESNSNYILYLNNEKVIENNKRALFRLERIIRIENIFSVKLKLKLKIMPDSYFRIIITDLKNNSITIKKGIDTSGIKKGFYQEILDYPYKYYKQVKNNHADYMLAKIFTLLGSGEKFDYYRKYYLQQKSVFSAQQYAEELINSSINNSPENIKGWQIYKKLWKKEKNATPVLYRKFESLQKHVTINKKIYLLKKFSKILNTYLPFQKKKLSLFYSYNFEMEFFQSLNTFKKFFPFSSFENFLLYKFYLNKNYTKSIKFCKKIIKTKKEYYTTLNLIDLLVQQEKYTDAMSSLKEYLNIDNIQAEIEKSKILIKEKKYSFAKDHLMKLLSQKRDPLIYYYLGKIQLLQNKNADLYWSKLESILPDSKFPTDYLDYKKTNKIISPLDSLRDKKKVNSIITDFLKKKPIEKNILFRGHYYKIKKEGRGQYLNEELIYIKTDKDIKKWGEYHIPYQNNVTIYKARIFHQDGKTYDAYKIQKTSQGKYITLNNIKKNSLLHVVYQKNYFFNRLSGSRFIYTSLLPLQNYNEKISHCEVKIQVPKNFNLNIYISKPLPVINKPESDYDLYFFKRENPSEINYEKYCDYSWKNLITYSFDNFRKYEDFILWYKGNWPAEKKLNLKKYININPKLSIKEKVIQIYNYIAREINLQGNLYFYPEDYSKILFNKKGSVEDKVFLARKILDFYGIKSYPALVLNELSMLKENNSVYNSIQHILLYIPVTQKKQYWLDFSSEFYKAGTVKDLFNNKQAVIILKNKNYTKKIFSSEKPGIISKYNIIIKKDKSASLKIETSYKGTEEIIKKYFLDKRYNEDLIVELHSFIKDLFILKDYNISPIKNFKNKFSIKVNGELPGFALPGSNSISFIPILKKTFLTKYILYTKRNLSLRIRKPFQTKTSYTYILPKDYISSEINIVKIFKCLNGYAFYSIKKEKKSLNLYINQMIYFPASIIKPEDYSKFLKFCMRINSFEKQRISLSY